MHSHRQISGTEMAEMRESYRFAERDGRRLACDSRMSENAWPMIAQSTSHARAGRHKAWP